MVSGVEDDDKVAKYPKESGELEAKFLGLSVMNGKVRIDVEESFLSDVAILMGGTNSFEHYLLNQMQLTVKVPNGNYKKLYLGRTNSNTFFS